MDSMSAMIGPLSMIVAGMLMGGIDLKHIFTLPSIWKVAALRLVVFPLALLAVLKFSGLAALAPDGETILLISFLAASTPAASTVTQMAQVYGPDGTYAGAINVATTLLCIITMPVVITLYQM